MTCIQRAIRAEVGTKRRSKLAQAKRSGAKRPPNFPRLEKALAAFVRLRRKKGLAVGYRVLRRRAIRLFAQLEQGRGVFKASNNYLSKFYLETSLVLIIFSQILHQKQLRETPRQE